VQGLQVCVGHMLLLCLWGCIRFVYGADRTWDDVQFDRVVNDDCVAI